MSAWIRWSRVLGVALMVSSASVDARAGDCDPPEDISGDLYEITSAKLVEVEEGGDRYRLWQGQLDLDGALDGMLHIRTVARADLAGNYSEAYGIGRYVASARARFPLGTELLAESDITFPDLTSPDWHGTIEMHADGAHVLISVHTNPQPPFSYDGTITYDCPE